jgi:hypothetical protein
MVVSFEKYIWTLPIHYSTQGGLCQFRETGHFTQKIACGFGGLPIAFSEQIVYNEITSQKEENPA